MRCFIIDDEELARELLRVYCQKIPAIEIVGEFSNVLDAQKSMKEQEVDLLLLDIQMPNKTGMELINELTYKPLVIFTTAYSEFAVEGFELNVTDYLLKPFSFDRFEKAIRKAQNLLASTQKGTKDYVIVNSEHNVYKIAFQEIDYIQSHREYVAYYYDDSKVMTLGSLRQLEIELPSDKFMRVHKSYIVAKAKANRIAGNVLYLDKVKIPIGPSYKAKVLQELF